MADALGALKAAAAPQSVRTWAVPLRGEGAVTQMDSVSQLGGWDPGVRLTSVNGSFQPPHTAPFSVRHTQHCGGCLGWASRNSCKAHLEPQLLSCLESWLSGTAFSLMEPIFLLTSAGKAPEHCESGDPSPT